MSLERYFQRAHDEARGLLRDYAALNVPVAQPTRWMVAADAGVIRNHRMCAPTLKDAVDSTLASWGLDRSKLVCTGRAGPIGLRRVLDRAMVDTDGSPTLAAGEGAEARRLLEMVGWDGVPQARWPEVFDTLRMAVVWRAAGHENWLSALRSLLEEDGYLVDGAKRCAA